MTTATAETHAESAQRDTRGPNGRLALIHLAILQLIWLAVIAFGIYSAASS